ncbi:LAQU0S27e00342g1_1 [Lachancea quebecensis]|uniref:LAQU0S27e00342g1_1 n=1 Tax=Lachancea quebecensis TaxID=1654605 RepID=A0A0N7MMH3_9SACH|nr:LAQU0S27e00342g1_1 [Lachancea quebecensis]
MNSTVEVRLDNIFFQSYTKDPTSGSAIYVFDSTYLPSADDVESREVYDLLIDEMMDKLVTKLPELPFSLVVFSSGFTQNNVSWIYGVKMFAKIPKSTRAKLQKMLIVHESFFVRTVYQVLTNALNINPFKNKNKADAVIHHVADLSELAEYVDITRLRISLNVYLYDYQFNETISVPESYVAEGSSLANRQYRQLVFDKIFKRLQIEAPKHELVFQRPGSYQKVNVLLGVIARNNYVDLSQWDIYSLATVFLHFIKGKTKPILPIDLIPLPISDSFEYTYNTFVSMMLYNGYYELALYIFELFLSLVDKSEVTLHDYRTLSKCLTATLCKEKVSLKTSDRLAIGYRYTSNVLLQFHELRHKIDKKGALKAEEETRAPHFTREAPKVPPPRKNSPSKACRPSNSSKERLLQNKPPALPKRKGIPSSSATSLPATDSRTERSPSPQPRASRSDLSLDSAEPRSPKLDATPNLRLGSNSSINVSMASDPNASPQYQPQLIPDEAVTFKSKPKDDLFRLDQNMSSLLLDNNQKIQRLDKELKKKKQASNLGSEKFSNSAYSDIKAENKVSRLAALYEERLVGIRVMEDMRRNQ